LRRGATNLRIGIDARPLAVPTTGIGRYTYEIVSRLINSPNEFFLYGFRPLALDFDTTNVRVRHADRQLPLMSNPHSQSMFALWAREDCIDVFWSPRHHLPLLTHVPTVVTIHDMVWKCHGKTMVRMGRLIEALLMPASLRKARRVIAVSEATAGEIIAFYPEVEEKISVIAEASSLDQMHPGKEACPAQPYMLFVGTVEPRKNLENILRAFRSLIETGAGSHRLVVAGNPGWKNEGVHRLLEEPALASRVDVLGKVSNERLVSLYQSADFLVAPSLYEGFGLVVLEAMGFGVPVITANVSSLPEVAGDASILVDPTDVDAIAKAMGCLIEDRDLHRQLSQRGLDRSTLFSWDRASDETLEVLEEAVGPT
jgi:glycosyltransferase involved in cell wall biosynthesis